MTTRDAKATALARAERDPESVLALLDELAQMTRENERLRTDHEAAVCLARDMGESAAKLHKLLREARPAIGERAMTDIVEQLRSAANCDWAKPTRLDIWAAFTRFVDLGEKREWSAADVLNDAADEIDRLRGLLREALHADNYDWCMGLRDRIEAALGNEP